MVVFSSSFLLESRNYFNAVISIVLRNYRRQWTKADIQVAESRTKLKFTAPHESCYNYIATTSSDFLNFRWVQLILMLQCAGNHNNQGSKCRNISLTFFSFSTIIRRHCMKILLCSIWIDRIHNRVFVRMGQRLYIFTSSRTQT